MSMKDPHATLRRTLLRCNLCELERLSGVPARTLRRIRNGTGSVQDGTLTRITPHLDAARMGRNEPKARAMKAAAKRALNSAVS